jgi:chorismate synthase
MKPISTTLTPIPSVDLATGEPAETVYERSDFCAVPRAAVVGEGVVATVLADALIEKLGGDSIDEMRPRFEALRKSRLEDLPMDNEAWRFGFSD